MDKRAAITFSALIFFSVLLPHPYLEAKESNNVEKTGEKYSTLLVSLGDEFILHANQSAKLVNDDFEIKIVRFYNSPCPPAVRCVWSGIGMAFEYRHAEEVMEGVNLVQAFGYRTTIIDSDNETYAKLKITEMD